MSFGPDQGWPSPGWSPPPSRRGPLIVVLAVIAGAAVLIGVVVFVVRTTRFPSKTFPVRVANAQGGSPAAPAGGTVITPAQAAGVVRTYWAAHEQALAARDLPALARLNVGAAREWEQPSVRCSCLSISQHRPLQSSAVLVTRQRAYPASFLAEVLTEYSGSYWVELLAFEKTAAGRPWQVALDSGFGPSDGKVPTLIAGDLDAQGYDKPVSAAHLARAQQMATHLAQVWTDAKVTGEVPVTSEFDLNNAGGRRVELLAEYRQDEPQKNGIPGHFTFFTKHSDPVFEAATENGGALACQPIRETVRYTADPVSYIYQDPSRHNWGPELAPGQYHQLTDVDTWQTCYVLPLIPADPITVLDQDIGGGFVKSSS